MTHRILVRLILSILFVVTLSGAAQGQGSAFTYQGRLTDGVNPADGLFDMQFKLFDTQTVGTGAQQGPTITDAAVSVTNGVFSVSLNFTASAFDGSARFLEISIRPAGSPDPYTTLSPRQPITAAPYSILSSTAANALQLEGRPSSGFVLNSNTQQAATNFSISGNGALGSNNTIIGSGADVGVNSLSFATAIGAGVTVSTNNTVVLGRGSDQVQIFGTLQLFNIALPGGTTELCRNGDDQVVSCGVSSLRYKERIAPLTSGLELIKRLNPITFDWKATGERDLGFAAEDVARVEPLLAVFNKQGQVEGVRYNRIAVVLAAAIKQQQELIERQ